MQKPTLLVCDDEELIRWSLSEHLVQEGYTVRTAEDGDECLAGVAEYAPALVLLDLKMPKRDGLSTLRELRARGNDVPVIVITAHSAIESAIEATQLGASAYVQKPFDLREVSVLVDKTLEEDRMKQEVHYLRRRVRQRYGGFVGTSAALAPVFDTLDRLQDVSAPTVLITGESGTGKDVLARAIHGRGPRKDQVFMEIDCAALPEQLIESELFGHERGAFTDARQTKRGLFEVAKGGVVFLDEIGEMSIATQAKLLRALENRTFKRVGGVAPIRLDAQVIAATNRDLKQEIEDGTFREDLFFRLNVIPIHLPPLRQRADDIPLLANHLLERFNQTLARHVEGVTEEALGLMQRYSWPGNVRELRNVLERIVILSSDDRIDANHLPPEIRFAAAATPRSASPGVFVLPDEGVDLEDVERSLIVQAIEREEGNQSAAARLLGITRYALRYRLEKYGLA